MDSRPGLLADPASPACHHRRDQRARYRLPPAVLEPAFHDAESHGYLQHRDGQLALTTAGQAEVSKLITALRSWLAAELADWDPNDQQLMAALDTLAARVAEQEPALTSAPA